MAVSHANCTHPRTPAGRRACRAGVAAPKTWTVADALKLASTMTGAELAANGNAKTEAWILEHGTPAAKRRINAKDRVTEIRENAAAARQRENDRMRAAGRVAKDPKPARIQPRRSGARVSATGSTCVQAALHIDAHGGRCACGWVAEKVA